MGTWWLPADGPVGTAVLSWERAEGGNRLSETVRGVVWQVRNGAHWLTWEEPEAGRTTLAVEPHRVRWLRFGDIAWQQTFAAGETHHSQLSLMGRPMAVEIRTDRLEVDISSSGGSALIHATLTVQGEDQRIESALRFHREDATDAWTFPARR